MPVYYAASTAAEELQTLCFATESGVQVAQWNSPDSEPLKEESQTLVTKTWINCRLSFKEALLN